jgi:hypothetical protein
VREPHKIARRHLPCRIAGVRHIVNGGGHNAHAAPPKGEQTEFLSDQVAREAACILHQNDANAIAFNPIE